MRIKRKYQEEGEKRKEFLWFPVWNDYEFLWLETVYHYWLTDRIGSVEHYYERIEN